MADQEQKSSDKVVKVQQSRSVQSHLAIEKPAEKVTQSFKPKEKGAVEVVHHLFKLMAASFLKNDSYKKDNPQLIPMEHCHIWHNVDSYGKPMQHASFVGGHTHEVTMSTNPDGSISVKCGPPIQKKAVKDRAGRKQTKFVPVKFFDAFHKNEDGEDGAWIVDDHTHEFEYRNFERWTAAEMMARGGRIAPMDDGLASQRDALKKAQVQITE